MERKRKTTKGAKREKGKTALVTGACGFTGSHLVDMLIERGWNVVATDLEGASRRFLNPRAKFIPSDLTRKDTLEEVVDGVDVIFHPAAVFSYTAPLDLLRKVNVEGTRNLFEVATKRKVKKVVMWSTAGVYAVSSHTPEPIDEDGPLGPSNNYEISKLEQEEVAMEFWTRGDLDVTIIRPAPIYGPRSFYGFAYIIFGVAEMPDVVVLPKIRNRAVSVHVLDVCASAIFLAETEGTGGEVFNVVDDGEYTYSEVITKVARILGKKAIELPVTLPQLAVRVIADISAFAARGVLYLKQNYPELWRKLGPAKYIEEDTARYMKYDYRFSNRKLKSIGYKFLYPDPEPGWRETINWYRQNGYIR